MAKTQITTRDIKAGTIVNANVSASAAIDASKIGTGVVSNAEFAYLDGVTSPIQTQINALSGGGGSVTSVGLSLPSSLFTVTGSPVTTTGTLNGSTLVVQNANKVWAGPTTGADAAPAFRALVAADIPSLPTSIITSGTFGIARIPTGSSSSTVCVGDDSRLSDARTPTSHASSHQDGGGDEIATATAAANAIPKAGAGGTLAVGWIPTGIDAANIGGGAVSNTEFAYLDGVTSAIQTQIDAKAAVATTLAGYGITDAQPLDADLTSIAALGSAADKGLYTTGAHTWAEFALTSAGRALIDDADATAQRATLGLVIGTNVQAYDAELAAIAGLTSAANKLPYFTGSGAAALVDFTPAGFSLTLSANATIGGTNTGDQTSVSGNAGTVTVADAGGDTTCWVLLATSQTGDMSPATDAGITYNATTNALTATTFIGALTGNASGSSGSCTGNAATATALQTSRNINGTAFDGTADVTITCAAGTLTGATLAAGVTGSSLTSVGTIVTGVWHGTLVGVLYGGTGADMSGTGGTSFLVKQASVGAALTAGLLTIAELAAVIQTVVTTADFDNASAGPAYADVTGMGFSLASGATYLFIYLLATDTAATSTVPVIGVNGPTNSLLTVNTIQPNVASNLNAIWKAATAFDSGATPSVSTGTTDAPNVLFGAITTTAAGTLALRLKNSVGSSRASILKGSIGICIRTA